MSGNTEHEGAENAIPVWDPVWERTLQNREWGKYPPEYVVRFVARHFYGAADRRGIRLLDLGCGPGPCTWYMAREGFAVAGIDGSATAIQRAAARLKKHGLNADLRNGDFGTLPWPADYFDGVIDNVALYASPLCNARKAVLEVNRVLKPGGLFLSASFSDRTWGWGSGPLVEPGGFASLSEGPIAGTGFCRFLGRGQLDELYAPLKVVSLETQSYTLEQMTRIVETWITVCKKAASE